MDYYVYSNHKTEIIRIADKSSVYALYVLALAGQPELSIMNFYRTAPALLTTDTRYLLAGSFALSGDRKSFLDLLPAQFVIEDPLRTSGVWFDSPIRANAIVLNVLLETDPSNANIPRYMDYLSKSYEAHEWYSTQDDAFTLLAFGKAARRAGSGKFDGTINIAGSTQQYSGGNQKVRYICRRRESDVFAERGGTGVLLVDHGGNSERRQHQDRGQESSREKRIL